MAKNCLAKPSVTKIGGESWCSVLALVSRLAADETGRQMVENCTLAGTNKPEACAMTQDSWKLLKHFVVCKGESGNAVFPPQTLKKCSSSSLRMSTGKLKNMADICSCTIWSPSATCHGGLDAVSRPRSSASNASQSFSKRPNW